MKLLKSSSTIKHAFPQTYYGEDHITISFNWLTQLWELTKCKVDGVYVFDVIDTDKSENTLAERNGYKLC